MGPGRSICVLLILALAGCVHDDNQDVVAAIDQPLATSAVDAKVAKFIKTQGSNSLCFRKIYVPAKYAVNTRGKLVRPALTHFEISDGGTRWTLVKDPPVYLERKSLIEPDHFSLHEVACEPQSVAYKMLPEGHGSNFIE